MVDFARVTRVFSVLYLRSLGAVAPSAADRMGGGSGAVRIGLALSALLLLGSPLANAQAADDPTAPVTVVPSLLPIDAGIDAVTLYQGRAAVTRSASATFKPGVYRVRFANLPGTVFPDSLQATVGAPAKLLDVNYEERAVETDVANNPEAIRLKKELETLERTLGQFNAKRETMTSSLKLLDALSTRMLEQTVKGLGTDALDPAKFAEQIDAVAKQRDAISSQRLALEVEIVDLSNRITATAERLEAIGDTTKVERTGYMTIAVPTEITTPVDLHFTYLVSGATWRPNYSVRAASDLSGLQVDYDAAITQHTGESWENVRLTLSTAQPAHAAEPPEIEPIYVELVDARLFSKAASSPPPTSAPGDRASIVGGGRGGGGGFAGEAEGNVFGDPGEDAEDASKDANVQQNATAATFVLPRSVSLTSDREREQSTRIATIDLKPTYTYVARPLVDLAAYLRGTVKNDSKFQILRGRARIFLGGDSVGVTMLNDVAPDGEFELWFGADKRITLDRKLIARNLSTSGLLSKSDDIEWQWKITVKNAIETATSIEIWDRMPVSRDEDVDVTIRDVVPPLANDKKYEANELKQGLLKWALTLQPKTAERGPSSMSISWTVKLSKPEKSMISPLPE